MKFTPQVKFWLSTETSSSVYGSGKHRLLKAIDEYGSLSAAAEKLNISYRKAWADLNKAEVGLGVKLVNRQRGGASGGRTSLTPEGRKLIGVYSVFTEKINRQVKQTYEQVLEGQL